MKLILHPIEIPLRHPWTLAHGTRTVQRNVVVELHDEQAGLSGFGEAAGIPYFGVTTATLIAALEGVRGVAEGVPLLDPESWWAGLAPHLAEQPFALAALDAAAHDLWAKRAGSTTRRMLGFGEDEAAYPPSDFTIGLAEPDAMAARLAERPGFPVYKVKLGSGDLAADLARVERLREETDAPLRVDANTGWTLEQAIEAGPRLVDLGVEFLEQPLRVDAPEAERRRLFEESPLPVIADEACFGEADVARCAGFFHGVNLKPAKCGGLTPALRMAAEARDLGLRVGVGCMTETTVGISATAQLLPAVDFADLDGALLLADDVVASAAAGVTLDSGRLRFPPSAGNGVQPAAASLLRLRTASV
ncbi:dipeptide epimerase [Phycisphaera mikurensis]|uniref:Dipeptide epimerase n=1 Tax=Phycisphaera mikurensis (strain NBRC 102666 / KCTC 22515 / FYK2301M01) TaxID=1142394 RepID=I0IE82_PHYMF|nr:dipeptide epimerase [Phycisphaera mikurensis]MBB6441373.1 L-alanine-DL-glutamate epimerase-like enolase superfamily enzyme [Phycisphaera mikurensis]BAM03570.1 putative dipeptide epimerase [Phycisphaera mikurensis NBRC 102666]